MDTFTFYAPTYFVFGKHGEEQAGECVKRFGGSKVLLHYGGGSVVRSGLLDRIKASWNAKISLTWNWAVCSQIRAAVLSTREFLFAVKNRWISCWLSAAGVP